MDVVELLNTKPMRCPREDMTSDLVVEVWFSLYWGLCGHHVHAPDPPLGASEGVMGVRNESWYKCPDLLGIVSGRP